MCKRKKKLRFIYAGDCMKNKLKLLITILVLFSMSTYSSVSAVTPNYFDATIKMKVKKC